MQRYLTTGEGPVLGKRMEMTGRRADESEFPVELAIVPIEMGETTIFTGHVRDLTKRKRAEEELQQAREELESGVEQRVGLKGAHGLTFRELTVLQLLSSGQADKEIAATLGISVARALRRKRKTTRMTRPIAITSVRSTSCSDVRIVVVRSIATLRSMSVASEAESCGSSA